MIMICALCSYKLAGKGVHITRVLHHCLMESSGFSFPPTGKYYLVDAAYQMLPEFLPPFKVPILVRNGGRCGSGSKEIFDKSHSALCIVIEQTFGVLKKRFTLLRGPVPNFIMTTQMNVVFTNGYDAIPFSPVQRLHASSLEIEEWKAWRTHITNIMFNGYCNSH
ncbi:hypothetical protein ACH5RR_039465 [Cinchona calisaya]|uniref:DDE Tnp4 domain-containing protein n=1 Tax=Cinchona calisaya TaxID=153742 RepID=A0ABD2Y3E9_9GENT